MKKSFSFFIVPFLLVVPLKVIKGQAKSLSNGNVYFSGIVIDSPLSKNTLYINAKTYFVDAFQSAKDVIQLDDKDNGIIMGKGSFEIPYKMNFMFTLPMTVGQTIKIYIKDFKYKYEFTDFNYEFFTPAVEGNPGEELSGSLDNLSIHNSKMVINEVENSTSKCNFLGW